MVHGCSLCRPLAYHSLTHSLPTPYAYVEWLLRHRVLYMVVLTAYRKTRPDFKATRS